MDWLKRNSANHWLASIFGVLSAIGVALHGIGEVLQGNIAPSSTIIESWAIGPLAEHMGGDPGMTIIPSFLVTGIIGLIVSVIMVVWSLKYVQRRFGGLVLFLLAVAALLFGGGFGPPTVGLLAGIGGMCILGPHNIWKKILGVRGARWFALLWPPIFAITVLNGLFLFVGHILLVFVFGFTHDDPFVISYLLSIPTMLLSIVTGVGWDLHNRQDTE